MARCLARLALAAFAVVASTCRTSALNAHTDSARAQDGLDSDGDGSISASELADSRFFRDVDANADGTLSDDELMRTVSRFGARDVHPDVSTRAEDAVRRVNQDSTLGIQVADLARYWRRLSALSTPDEVSDWIAHAVMLPQYAGAFRENSVKGVDLPLLLDDPGFIKELGVASRLHAQQILRSISMRLLGLGQPPPQPRLVCDAARVARWDPAPSVGSAETDAETLAVHRWRVFSRAAVGTGAWTHEADLPGDAATFELASGAAEARVEAWNVIGRSAGAYAACVGPSSSSSSSATQPAQKKTQQASAFFSTADLDGDGDIDGAELQRLVASLNMPDPSSASRNTASGDAPAASDARAEDVKETEQNAFLARVGVARGLDALDGNRDRVILPRELEKHWAGMQSLMTVSRTVDWLAHAVELPQYAGAFRERGVTGFDLARLVGSGGENAENAENRENAARELGIEDAHDRHLLTRAVTVLFLGIGAPPSRSVHALARPGTRCGEIRVEWAAPARGRAEALGAAPEEMPVHKYRLLRRELAAVQASSSSRADIGAAQEEEKGWIEVYAGMGTGFSDGKVLRGTRYVYRVEAWNLLGVSPAYETSPTVPDEENCVRASAVAWRAVSGMVLAPWYLLTLVLDNYYRITAVLSFAGFMLMFANVPSREKVRVVMSVRDRVVPMLKNALGTGLGVDTMLNALIRAIERSRARAEAEAAAARRRRRAAARGGLGEMDGDFDDDDFDDGHHHDDDHSDEPHSRSPRSPHQDMVTRAVEAAFPSSSSRSMPARQLRSALSRSSEGARSESDANNQGNGAARRRGRRRGGSVPGNENDENDKADSSRRVPQLATPPPQRTISQRAQRALYSLCETSADPGQEGPGRPRGRSGSLPADPGQTAAASRAASRWGLVKRHVNMRRAVNAFSASLAPASDTEFSYATETSSVASDGSPARGATAVPRGRSSRILASMARGKRKLRDSVRLSSSSDNSNGNGKAQPKARPKGSGSSNGNGNGNGLEASIRVCAGCGAHVRSLTRHTCGVCHLVYCRGCTAYKAHMPLTPCDVDSKCRCRDCVDR